MILYLVLTDNRFRVMLCIFDGTTFMMLASLQLYKQPSFLVSVKAIDLNAQIRAILTENGIVWLCLTRFSSFNLADSTVLLSI